MIQRLLGERPKPRLRSEESEEGDESMLHDNLDRPPAQFIRDAREMYPAANQISFFRAWSLSKGIGHLNAVEYERYGERESAALAFVLDFEAPPPPLKAAVPMNKPDLANPTPPINLPPPPPQPIIEPGPIPVAIKFIEVPPAVKRNPSLVKPIQKPIHIPIHKPGPQPYKNPIRAAQRNDGKGKGRAIVISSGEDTEDSDVEIVPRASRVKFADVNPPAKRLRPSPAKKDPLPALKNPERAEPKQEPIHLPVPGPNRPAHEISPEEHQVSLEAILQIVPDVLPSHVLSLLKHSLYAGKVDVVLDALFNGDYPKIEVIVKESKKEKEIKILDEEDLLAANDYYNAAGRQRMGHGYEEVALAHLTDRFNTIPVTFIKATFKASSFFYASAHLALEKAESSQQGYRKLGTARQVGKGKGRATVLDVEVEKEKSWIIMKKRQLAAAKVLDETRELKLKLAGEAGMLIECGCCYGDFCFDELVQCSEAHLFCKECAVSNANTQIGLRNFILPCMAEGDDGCVFTESEFSKFLPPTSIAALHKIRMEKEIDLAQLADLAKCPFCPYACVIDNEHERLFTCMREGCEVVSCRECKKPDHLPKTCLEMDSDRIVDARHTVEEAMTAAFIRNCPKCSNPYTKSEGCNKIVCPTCGTLSCFICGKVVAGYQHFANAGSNGVSDQGATCDLWDRQPGEREYLQVEAARVEAAALVANQIDLAALDDLKGVAPPAAPAHLAHLAGLAGLPHFQGLHPQGIAANNLARLDPGRMALEAHQFAVVRARAIAQARHDNGERDRILLEARRASAAKIEASQKRRKAVEDARDAKRARLLQ